MRYTLSFLVVLLLLCCAGCAHTSGFLPSENSDPRLYGKWKSDLKKTMDFNSKYAKLTERQVEAFKKMFGKLIMEYSENGTVKSYFPEYDNPNELSVDECQYRIIAKDSERIIITDNSHLKEDAIFELELLQVIHFTDCSSEEDDDRCDCCKTFWVYIDKHPIFRFQNMHIREYFTKIE